MNAYKLWVIDDDRVVDVVVFNGENEEDFSIFSDEEFDLIDSDIGFFSKLMIHADDSIRDIKHKIMKEIDCEYGDIYLFCYKKRRINVLAALNKTDTVDKQTLTQFIKNLDLDGINTNTCLESTDVASLGFDTECVLSLKTSIGFHNDNNFLFSVNPFHAKILVDENMQADDSKILGKGIEDNNIYMCLAKDVLKRTQLDADLVSKIYFPFLNNNATPSPDLSLDAIDELYLAYYQRPDDMVVKSGIRSFRFEMETKTDLSLETLFRNAHCDTAFPFIKLNRGFHSENVYRLYGTNITKSGKRIPLLSKDKISELMNIASGYGHVVFYNSTHDLLVQIDEDGCIAVSADFDEVKTIFEIEIIVKTVVNPLFGKYCNYRFLSFKDNNVRNINMNYIFSTNIGSSLGLQNNKYMQAVFDKQDNGEFRFRRVDRYEKMDKFSALVFDIYQKHGNVEDTVDELVEEHGFLEEDAKKQVVKPLKHAGLKTNVSKEGSWLTFEVFGLDNVEYVDNLSLYIDSIVRFMKTGVQIERLTYENINKKMEQLMWSNNQDDYDDCIGFSDDDDLTDESSIKSVLESDDEDKDDKEEDGRNKMRNVMLENKFSALYWSIAKSLMKSAEIQDKMVKIVENTNLSYNVKIKTLVDILQRITSNHIVFTTLPNKLLDSLNNNASSVVKSEDEIMFPKRNLVNKEDNRDLYARQAAKQILMGKELLKMGVAPELSINGDEFVVLESLLKSPAYFKDMIPSLDNDCMRVTDPIQNGKWPMFAGAKRLEFKQTPECSFGPLVYIMSVMNNNQGYSLPTMRQMLWKAYLHAFEKEDNKTKLLSIMKKEDKADMIGTKTSNEELEELVKSEAYFVTSVDMHVFAEAYGVPIVLFTSSGKWSLLGNKEKGEGKQFFFYESPNVLINRTFRSSEMGDFESEFVS
jgi:hypothetical protein